MRAKNGNRKVLWCVILGVAIVVFLVLVVVVRPAVRLRQQIIGQWRGDTCLAVFKSDGTVWIEETSPGFSKTGGKGEVGEFNISVARDGRTRKITHVNSSGVRNGASANYTMGFTTVEFRTGDSFLGGMWGEAKLVEDGKIHLQALIENTGPGEQVREAATSRIDAILTREGDAGSDDD